MAKGTKKIKFDRIISTGKGHVSAVDIIPRDEVANPILDKGKLIPITALHDILGHTSEESLGKL